MDKDQHSKDVSNAILVGKLAPVGAFESRQDWSLRSPGGGGVSRYAIHTFKLEGAKYFYKLSVYEDHSFKAVRVNPDDPHATPRTMSDDFAKLLYMKVWPDVGV